MVTKLFHTLGFTREEGDVPGGKGLCPVVPGPPSLPIPTQEALERKPFSPQPPGLCLAVVRDLGKRQRTGNNRSRKEVRKRRMRPQPAHTQPYHPSGLQSNVSKNIYMSLN